MNKFAVILPWPYNIPSAEKEIVDRLIVASKNIGVECVLADRYGFILDKNLNVTQDKISDVSEICFALHTHFDTTKWDDVFSFYTLWNPVSLLFLWNNFLYHSFSYLSYDDYLSSDSVNPIKHINHLLSKTGRNFDNSIFLFPTSTKQHLVLPNLAKSRKKVFYCGNAWEKSAGAPVRHEKLFRKLESSRILEIYGPKKANGIEPWKDYKSYVDEIPFDGYSIFKKINEVGIVLALSSLEHQKAGVMSNRIFEAAAGGAVIITDKNDFVQKYFKDSVLMVDNTGDWEETANQIVDAFNWIIENEFQAQIMAEKAQEIYKKHFLMEDHLASIFDRLEDRKLILSKQIFAQKNTEQIDVILRWDKYSLQEFGDTIKQISKQIYCNIRVIVVVDNTIVDACEKIIKNNLNEYMEYTIIPMKIFNPNEIRFSPLYRIATTGQMLSEALKVVKNDYIAFIKSNDIWFSDHLTTLKRVLEDDAKCNLSHSSLSSRIVQNNKIKDYYDDFFQPFSIDKINEFNTRESDGLIMVRKELLSKLDTAVMLYLDYLDFHYIVLNALKLENGVKFTYRKTALKTYYLDQKENPQDFLVVQYNFQKGYIASLMQFDFSIEQLLPNQGLQQAILQQQSTSIPLNDHNSESIVNSITQMEPKFRGRILASLIKAVPQPWFVKWFLKIFYGLKY